MSNSGKDASHHNKNGLISRVIGEEASRFYNGCSCADCYDPVQEPGSNQDPIEVLFNTFNIPPVLGAKKIEEKFHHYISGNRVILLDKSLRELSPEELCPCSHEETPVTHYLASLFPEAQSVRFHQRESFGAYEFYMVCDSDTRCFSELSSEEILEIGGSLPLKAMERGSLSHLVAYKADHLES
jgi:hypothetical protein